MEDGGSGTVTLFILLFVGLLICLTICICRQCKELKSSRRPRVVPWLPEEQDGGSKVKQKKMNEEEEEGEESTEEESTEEEGGITGMDAGGPAPASRYALSVETGDGNEHYQDEAALVAAKEDAEWREPSALTRRISLARQVSFGDPAEQETSQPPPSTSDPVVRPDDVPDAPAPTTADYTDQPVSHRRPPPLPASARHRTPPRLPPEVGLPDLRG